MTSTVCGSHKKKAAVPSPWKAGKWTLQMKLKGEEGDTSQCRNVEYIPLKVIKGKHFVFEIAGLEYTRLNKRNAYIYYIE